MRRFFLFASLTAVILTACTNYGKKVSQDYLEVYYKDGITKEQAQKTLDFLYPVWKSKTGKTDTKSVQLTKAGGDTVNFRFVVDKDKLKDMDDETFYIMGTVFSDSIFNGAPVNVVLADNSFKTIRTLAFKKTTDPAADYGEKVTSGNIELFTKDGLDADGAQDLAKFLDKTFSPSNIVSFQIGKNSDGVYILSMVSTPEKSESLTEAAFHDMCSKVSNEMLSGGPMIFQLTDNTFHPFKTYEYKPAEQTQDTPTVNQ